MGRKKLKLQLIENTASRRVSYTKRVKGVVRKTQELSVLCGVDACCVIYGPYNQAPVVWPPCEMEARRILTNFKQKRELNPSQRHFDQDAFLKESIKKAEEKLLRLQRRNREMEMENIITEVLKGRMTPEQVPHSDLGDLLWVLEDKLKGIEHRLTQAKSTPAVANSEIDGNEDGGADLDGGSSASHNEDDYGLSAIVQQSLTIKQMQTGGSSQNQTVV